MFDTHTNVVNLTLEDIKHLCCAAFPTMQLGKNKPELRKLSLCFPVQVWYSLREIALPTHLSTKQQIPPYFLKFHVFLSLAAKPLWRESNVYISELKAGRAAKQQ